MLLIARIATKVSQGACSSVIFTRPKHFIRICSWLLDKSCWWLTNRQKWCIIFHFWWRWNVTSWGCLWSTLITYEGCIRCSWLAFILCCVIELLLADKHGSCSYACYCFKCWACCQQYCNICLTTAATTTATYNQFGELHTAFLQCFMPTGISRPSSRWWKENWCLQ